MGLPGLGALGVTFGKVVAMDSPSGRKPGDFHWASTLWHELSRFDPFFYMIDGFRYAMLGSSDGSVETGIIVMLSANIVLYVVTAVLFSRGYRLKT